MTATTDLTDRDRLVLALDALREIHGYWIPNPDQLAPGPSIAVDDVPDDVPYVTWHAQTDDVAFGYGWSAIDDCPTCAVHAYRLHRLFGDDDSPICEGEWPDDTEERLDLDEKVHIAEEHRNLVRELNLHWAGDPALICRVLRRHGLDAREPEDDETTIAVLPADPRGWPHWASCGGEHRCFQGHHHRYKPPAFDIDQPTLPGL
jgi:hypothetical protein